MIKTSRKYDYSDLDLDFLPHPTTGDVMKKTGIEAVKRSIRNLVMTNFYEKPFRPYVGSNALKLLFDNPNPLTAGFLRDAIEEMIINYEPRVSVQQIEVKFDIDNNGYNVRLFFVVLNSGEPVVTTLFLERTR